MEMMQATGFRRYGEADVLELLDVPRPALAADTVLIRVVAAGVNPADWRIRSGQFRLFARLKLPFVPGSDIAGVVEAVGPAVRRFRPGDAVHAMLPSLAGGGYGQYTAVPEQHVAPMPANLSFVEAAAVPLAGLTALQALCDQADLQSGMHILINGASGGVGSFAVQIAKALGARVTAACSGRNVALVQNLGADAVLDYTQTDITTSVDRYDAVFDAANAYPVWRWRRVLKPAGVAVSVNPSYVLPPLGWVVRLSRRPRLRALLVQPSGADLETLGPWLADGTVRPLLDRSHPLEDAAAAHRHSETGRARGKIVLVVDDELASRAVPAKIDALLGPHASAHVATALDTLFVSNNP